MLEVIKLTKEFDGFLALNDVCLNVKPYEIYCMLGANGAGKTTTINLVFNFLKPTSGKAFVKGIDVTKEPVKAKQKLGYVSENVMLYENFTAMQNLLYFTKLTGKEEVSREKLLPIFNKIGFPDSFIDKKLAHYSKGMRQKCGLAIAIAKDADVIVLDEPTSGLDPKGGLEFLKILNDLRDEGKTIFMTTHDIFRAKVIADKIGILVQGCLVKEMRKEEIVKSNLEAIYMKYINESFEGQSRN